MKLILFCALALASRLTSAQNIQALTGPFPGPYGLIPFHQITVDAFEPAFADAVAQYRAQLAQIGARKDKPTFANTVAPLERAGEKLKNFYAPSVIFKYNTTSEEYQAVDERIATALAALANEVAQMKPVFLRLKAVYDQREWMHGEEKRVTELIYKYFVDQGALLEGEAKERLAEIDGRMAALKTRFQKNLDADQATLVYANKDEIEGIPESELAAAKVDGEEKWGFTPGLQSAEGILPVAKNRAFRQRLFEAFASRGQRPGPTDNRAVISELANLRRERARVLTDDPGTTHVKWRLQSTMAKNAARVKEVLYQIWHPLRRAMENQLVEMRALAAKDGITTLRPWDTRFYREILKREKFNVSQDEIRQYLRVNNVTKVVFENARKLWGLKFDLIPDAPVYAKDVYVYAVKRPDNSTLGILIFDPFRRAGKTLSPAAWAENLIKQGRRDGHQTLPIVTLNLNIAQQADMENATMSLKDALTFEHEFGHDAHGLFSDVEFPILAAPEGAWPLPKGPAAPMDWAEFHSQFMEHLMMTDHSLQMLTNRDGQPMPPELAAKIVAIDNFDDTFLKTEQLLSSFVDLAFHENDGDVTDPVELQAKVLAELGAPAEVPPRHPLTAFMHSTEEAYAGAYASYMLAEVLEYEVVAKFAATGDPYNPTLAAELRDKLYAVANTIDADEAYRSFAGRDANCDALIAGKGLISVEAAR